MNDDVKISELPVASTITSPDVAPIVQGGVTKQADVSLFGGSFLSSETVRVDPVYGDDSTGEVGNLSKPFATTQGVIDAFELLDPLPSNPIIMIGGNAVSGFSTILPYLTVIGENGIETSGSQRTASAITSAITMSAPDGPESNTVVLILKNCWTNHAISFDGSAPNQELDLINSAGFPNVDFNATGQAFVNGTSLCGQDSPFSRIHNIAFTGGVDTSLQLHDIEITNAVLSTDGTDAYMTRCTAANIAASINNLYLIDSFIMGTNSAGTTNTNFGNVLFNPANWDFSSLPTSEPTEVGKAWIDTTGGFNIVKVKL